MAGRPRRRDAGGTNTWYGHMVDLVVGVGGHARSGKTSIAEALAARVGLPLARFSREVERVARERGLPLDPPDVRRTTLMAVGEDLVRSDPEEFCRRVLAQAGWPETRSVIVEGVRHALVAETLGRLVTPAIFRLVLVDTPPGVRETRLAAEGLEGAQARARLDSHSTEREVDGALRARSSLQVEGTCSADDAAATIEAAMGRWGWASPTA